MNPTTQLINHLLTDKGAKGLANASHRAVAAAPSSPQAVSPLRASIVFREKLARDQEHRWQHLIEFAETSRRARAAEKAAGEDQ